MKKLTVAEYQKFKESSGEPVSKKTIYKYIRHGLLTVTTEKINNRDVLFVLIPEEGEEDLTILTPSSPSSPAKLPPSPSISPSLEVNNPQSLPDFYHPVLEILQKELEEKNRQLEEKDRQLLEKDKQIEREQEQNKEKDLVIREQLEKMNELLRNSQMLQAQVNNLLTAGPDNEPLKDDSIIETAVPAQKKKKSWFSRWMFGD